MRFPGLDGVSDLELPFPQAGLDLDEAKFDALAIHFQLLLALAILHGLFLADLRLVVENGVEKRLVNVDCSVVIDKS